MQGHTATTEEQFGRAAAAYLTSAVHREGADLQAAAAVFPEDAEVLDLGCGAGHVSYALAQRVRRVTAYDLSPRMLDVVQAEAARQGLTNLVTQQGGAEALPFADASFDGVTTRYSAHHWLDIRGAIREMRRVLKPGGKVVVIDIVAPPNPLLDTHLQALELLRDGSHLRDYTVAEWTGMLADEGLNVESQSFWKLPMDFVPWVERMGTQPEFVSALRLLLRQAPTEVREYFAVQEDASFAIDAMMLQAVLGR